MSTPCTLLVFDGSHGETLFNCQDEAVEHLCAGSDYPIFNYQKRRTVGHKFSLILNREITEDESEILRQSGCVSAVFGTDELPASAEVTVTRMNFDDAASASLREAIEFALRAVENVPDLSVPCITVPPQDADEPADAPTTADVVSAGLYRPDFLVLSRQKNRPFRERRGKPCVTRH
jgi:hypothetical protein